jgi:hypothetical protein
LGEGHRKKLVPARETTVMTIPAVAGHAFLELLVRQMRDQFREHEPANMHPPLSAGMPNCPPSYILGRLEFKSFPLEKAANCNKGRDLLDSAKYFTGH